MPLRGICVTLTQRKAGPIWRGFPKIEELFSFTLFTGAISKLVVMNHRMR